MEQEIMSGKSEEDFGASRVSFDFVNGMLKNIERRNRKAMSEISEKKKEFESEFDSMIRFINFRNKVDKLEAAYSLIFTQKQIKQMNTLTNHHRHTNNHPE